MHMFSALVSVSRGLCLAESHWILGSLQHFSSRWSEVGFGSGEPVTSGWNSQKNDTSTASVAAQKTFFFFFLSLWIISAILSKTQSRKFFFTVFAGLRGEIFYKLLDELRIN